MAFFARKKTISHIPIKTAAEIEKMRVAGRLAAEVLEMIAPHVRQGVTTLELDRICYDHMVKVQKTVPATLFYKGFPKSICTSINHQVCHGIPGDKCLKNGDILNIDITIIKDGYHGDTSKMFCIGTPSVLAQRLVRVTRAAMFMGITQVKSGATLGDVGHAIAACAKSHGFSIVEEFCGHGIGREFHEAPQVLHYGKPNSGDILKPGMCFTLEPMLNSGAKHVKILPDGWTVVTCDRSLSAQWEHTLLVTENGCEILTLREEEKDVNFTGV
jgi:methionyl aminopeptidase